jgi:hypothetical protein
MQQNKDEMQAAGVKLSICSRPMARRAPTTAVETSLACSWPFFFPVGLLHCPNGAVRALSRVTADQGDGRSSPIIMVTGEHASESQAGGPTSFNHGAHGASGSPLRDLFLSFVLYI